MKIKHILFCLSLLFSVAAWADSDDVTAYYDQIYLKDGSIYHGYITNQLNTGEIVIKYDWSIHTCDRSQANITTVEDISIITVGDKVYNNAVLLTDGDVITFKDMTPGMINSKTSQIEKTVRPITPGLNDFIKTNDGQSYRGHIVEVVPGKTMTIQRENGIPVVISSKNILTNAKERKSKDLTFLSQSPFYEEYVMKNEMVYPGLRVSQDYSNGSVIIYDGNDIPSSIDLKDIRVIRKSIREGFTVVQQRLEKDEIRVNGKVYQGVPTLGKRISSKKVSYLISGTGPLPFILVDSDAFQYEIDAELAPSDAASPYQLVMFNAAMNDNGDYEFNAVRTKDSFAVQSDDAYRKGLMFVTRYDHLPRGIYALCDVRSDFVFLIWAI